MGRFGCTGLRQLRLPHIYAQMSSGKLIRSTGQRSMKTTQSITPQLGPTALHRLAWPAVGAALSVKRCTRAPAPLLHARHSGVPTCPPVSTAVDWAAATPGSVPEVWRGSWCPCEAACCTQSSSKLQMSTLQ